jgi:hypothetical protein
MEGLKQHNFVPRCEQGNPAGEPIVEGASSEVAADPRLRRIRDYLKEALVRENALEANLAVVNSDLMWMGYALKQAIEAAMAAAPAGLDHFERLAPAIDSYLRVARQVDRFATLGLRVEGGRDRARAAARQLESTADQREEVQG